MKKKFITGIILICSLSFLMLGCGSSENKSNDKENNISDVITKEDKEAPNKVSKTETKVKEVENKVDEVETKVEKDSKKVNTSEEAMNKIVALNDLSELKDSKLSFMEFDRKPAGKEGYSFQVGINGETRFETIGYYFVSTEGETYKINLITDEFEPIS